MSVLITGMEMPKSCGDCPCLSETYCCCVDGVYPYDCNILIQETEEGAEFIGRLSNCPLIEVSKHGRLIDADALENEAQMRLLECNKYDNQFQKPYEVMRAIALAPTIIESEGE